MILHGYNATLLFQFLLIEYFIFYIHIYVYICIHIYVNSDYSQILHGEQYLEVFKELPTEATVETRFTLQDVLDKGKGAVVLLKRK